MVIIAQVGKNPNFLHVETWELVKNPGPVLRSRVNSKIPGLVTIFDIDFNGVVTPPNTPLIIPYNYLFDVPNANAGDVILTSNDPSSLAQIVFQATWPSAFILRPRWLGNNISE
jgi:hypothetical protein